MLATSSQRAVKKTAARIWLNHRIDFTLGDYIENLTLTGSALKGTGNGLNNIITGNEFANTPLMVLAVLTP